MGEVALRAVPNEPIAAGRNVTEKRESAFNDPRFWVSVTAIMLTLELAVFGFIAARLISIDNTLSMYMLMSTEQKTKIEGLEKDVAEGKAEREKLKVLIDDNEKTQRDYNFKMSNQMTEINTALGRKGD